MNVQTIDAPGRALTLAEELDQRTERWQGALPAHIPVAKFKSAVLTAVNLQPGLVKADRRSFFNACTQAVNDGLLPDGRESALVVYNNKVEVETYDEKTKTSRKVDKWVPFVQYIPMVSGIMKKVRNSGEIANWQIYAVHKNDKYKIIEGFDVDFIYERCLDGDPGPLIFCSSLVRFKDETRSLEIMTVFEIEKIRARSKVKSTSGPWSTDYEEMCKKTIIKRHAKRLPQNTDLMDLLRKDDALYDYEGQSDKQVSTEARRPQLQDFCDEIGGEMLDSNPKAPASETPTDEKPSPAATKPAHDPQTGEVAADENPVPEFGHADAMELGRVAFAEKKSIYSILKDLDEKFHEACKEGWREAEADAKSKA